MYLIPEKGAILVTVFHFCFFDKEHQLNVRKRDQEEVQLFFDSWTGELT